MKIITTERILDLNLNPGIYTTFDDFNLQICSDAQKITIESSTDEKISYQENQLNSLNIDRIIRSREELEYSRGLYEIINNKLIIYISIPNKFMIYIFERTQKIELINMYNIEKSIQEIFFVENKSLDNAVNSILIDKDTCYILIDYKLHSTHICISKKNLLFIDFEENHYVFLNYNNKLYQLFLSDNSKILEFSSLFLGIFDSLSFNLKNVIKEKEISLVHIEMIKDRIESVI